MTDRPTDELGCIKCAIRPLVDLYGDTPASEFGPIALKAVRQSMVDATKLKPVPGSVAPKPIYKKGVRTKPQRKLVEAPRYCRRFINMSMGRIRRVFKWAVENELVEPDVLAKLQAVAPLTAGRTTAQDYAARRPVPDESIELVKGKVTQRTRDLMELMLLCGARPGELVKLTGAMIDRSKDIWLAKLDDHKTVHRGKERVLVFGPKAQLILKRYLLVDPSKRLFPITRATASNGIKQACLELGLPPFTAHWLRHNAASRIRDEFSLDAAQVTLGHSSADITQLYAHLNLDKAIEVARDAG